MSIQTNYSFMPIQPGQSPLSSEEAGSEICQSPLPAGEAGKETTSSPPRLGKRKKAEASFAQEGMSVLQVVAASAQGGIQSVLQQAEEAPPKGEEASPKKLEKANIRVISGKTNPNNGANSSALHGSDLFANERLPPFFDNAELEELAELVDLEELNALLSKEPSSKKSSDD